MDEKLLTRKEVAQYFGVKPGTIKKWDQAGTIKPDCRLNGRPRYRQDKLNSLYETPKPSTNGK